MATLSLIKEMIKVPEGLKINSSGTFFLNRENNQNRMHVMKRVLAVLVWCAVSAVSAGRVAEDMRQPIPSSSEVSKRLILDNFQDETLCSEIGAYLEERIYPLNKLGEIKPLADWKEYEINYKIDGKIEETIEVFETTNGPIKDKKLLVRKKHLFVVGHITLFIF